MFNCRERVNCRVYLLRLPVAWKRVFNQQRKRRLVYCIHTGVFTDLPARTRCKSVNQIVFRISDTCTCLCAHTHTHTHTQTHSHTHARTHSHTHARTHARTHIHTHTHIHTLLSQQVQHVSCTGFLCRFYWCGTLSKELGHLLC